MKPRVLYAGLSVIGTILPYSQFIRFLQEYGLNLRLFLYMREARLERSTGVRPAAP